MIKKSHKKIRSDDTKNGYKAYTSKTYLYQKRYSAIIHGGNGTRLAYTPTPPPPSFPFMVTPLISILIHIYHVEEYPILTFDFIHPLGDRS